MYEYTDTSPEQVQLLVRLSALVYLDGLRLNVDRLGVYVDRLRVYAAGL